MPPVMQPGAYCHVEIPASDLAKTKKFFGDVFGWTFQSFPGMDDYVIYSTTEDGIGGGLWTPTPDAPKAIVNYILVKSVDAHSAKITAAGGQILKSKTEVPQMGWFAVFADPEGNTLGIWESMNPMPAPTKPAKKKAAKKAVKKAAKPAAKKAAKPAGKAAKAKAKPAKKGAKKRR